MKDDILKTLNEVVAELYGSDATITLTRPEPQFGDFTTNLALQLAKTVGKQPREIAEEVTNKLQDSLGNKYDISIAGPGFINIKLPDSAMLLAVQDAIRAGEKYGHNSLLGGKLAIVEGTDPNPFKQLHIGHVYSNTIGEAISGLHEASGAKVIRANYQGDVGMHVASSIWGMRQLLDGKPMDSVPEAERAEFMGRAYAHGASAFKEDESAKNEITAINKQVYQQDPSVAEEYSTGRKWSLDYFESQYKRLETSFDRYYFESESAPAGMKIIEENKEIFEESNGALVYKGEQDGLHTRVFINSEGLPTYEAKDLGLSALKEQEYSPDISITFTGNEIEEYFKVIKAVLGKINPDWANHINHIPHGMVRLPSGKMSSRTGDIVTAQSLLDDTEKLVRKQSPDTISSNENTLGAIKYAFLKHRIGGDIIFDIDESISLEGNSGPYIQYAHARMQSILSKIDVGNETAELTDEERELARVISLMPEAVEDSITDLTPHKLCEYLYSLAREFNRFYEKNRIVDDERQAVRSQLVKAAALTLNNGLRILNIPAPKRM